MKAVIYSTGISQEYMMRAKFGLPSIEAEETVVEKRPPIRVKFEIPYFTVSGIQVSILLLLGMHALPHHLGMSGGHICGAVGMCIVKSLECIHAFLVNMIAYPANTQFGE